MTGLKKHLKIVLFGSVITLICFLGLYWLISQNKVFLSPLSPEKIKVDYNPYSFPNLKTRPYYPSEIAFEKILKHEEKFTSYLFSFSVDGRRITGMANVPKGEGPWPVALLIRGWVDEEIYQTGLGTEKMADFLAQNGFLTLAPDLIGFGGSDQAFPDMLQTRFFQPITIITLLDSLGNLPQADPEKVVLWGHSNGGQIALSVLEITEKNIPTSLWAPVSAPFPESILHYTDELEDQGQLIKKTLAEFEKEYSVSQYSIDSFYGQIQAPLIVHQGIQDESIPLKWTENLIKSLNDLNKEVVYYKYAGENHNFHYGSAPLARERDLAFFKKWLKP